MTLFAGQESRWRGRALLLRRIMEQNEAEPGFVSLSRALREELAETGEPVMWRDIMTEMSMMEARIAMARKG